MKLLPPPQSYPSTNQKSQTNYNFISFRNRRDRGSNSKIKKLLLLPINEGYRQVFLKKIEKKINDFFKKKKKNQGLGREKKI